MGITQNRLYGDYGDEKETSTTRMESVALGKALELPDGRIYRYAKAGGAALSVGVLTEMPANLDAANVANLAIASAAAIGDTSVTITAGSVAVTEDDYRDGYFHVNDVTGEGYLHKILANAGVAASASMLVTLDPDDPIKIALVAGSSQVGISRNEYALVTVTTADTARTGPPAGITPVAVAASAYFWVQRRGVAAVLAGGTDMVAGVPIMRGGATVGEMGKIVAGSASNNYYDFEMIGYGISPATTSEYSLVTINLE